MSVRRVYDPPDCDEAGVPLDWERCRRCSGHGTAVYCIAGDSHRNGCACPLTTCPTCDGHGSLKAAALAALALVQQHQAHGHEHEPEVPAPGVATITVRCEDCGHPMSEGTWEDDGLLAETHAVEREQGVDLEASYTRNALRALREGREARTLALVHYSPCDEGCRHGGPGRKRMQFPPWVEDPSLPEGAIGDMLAYDYEVEASWRPVDVRTLGWPHDIRPEKLAVLCLRCYADRS